MSDKTITFTIGDDQSETAFGVDCLFVFIDETGIEDFSDPNYPIFGLGGCALPCGAYLEDVRPAWLQMKDDFFDGADTLLHANELGQPTNEQIEVLCQRLSSDTFTRVVAVASEETAFPEGHAPYMLIASSLIKLIANAAGRFKFSEVAFFVESSSRADTLANQYLGPFNKCRVGTGDDKVEIPIQHFFLPKTLIEPGIEMADFIMHTVGGQIRSRMLNPESDWRKDYRAIIKDVPEIAREYMSVTKVEVNAA